MAKPEFTLEFIKDQNRLIKLIETLVQTDAFALDIETIDWWNRQRERIALIQFAFRYKGHSKVAVIDTFANFSLEPLRSLLEDKSILKVIHNAAFDASRLSKHYDFSVAPIHDTMLAARRNGERKYSLQAQAAIHLNFTLDKSSRYSDWSRRPLDHRQLSYAALDSYSTLLLYENQRLRNLKAEYQLKTIVNSSQRNLPLTDSLSIKQIDSLLPSQEQMDTSGAWMENALDAVSASLLGIVAELPSRYSPDQLSVSLGADRVGIAGWIVDSRLGRDRELDEETVKISIAALCECGLLQMTQTRRLEATKTGDKIWREIKS